MAYMVGKVCYTDSYMKSIKHFRLIIQEILGRCLGSYLVRCRIASNYRVTKLQNSRVTELQNKCSTELLFKLIIIN